jgi:hypothetical protein
MNKAKYDNYLHLRKPQRTFLKTQFSEAIVANLNNKIDDVSIKKPSTFKILFTYIEPNNVEPNATTQYGYISSFFNGFNQLIDTKNYLQNLNFITDSIDVFGLGFSLQYTLNAFEQQGVFNLAAFTRLSAFFHKMYDFNPINRVIDIDILLNEYEAILLELGILTRLNKSFENHIIVSKSPVSPIIMKESFNQEKKLSIEMEQIAHKDAVEFIDVKCGPVKEFNHLTKRCVKKCKQNYTRNNKFKCVKETRKSISSIKQKSVKRKQKSVKRMSCPDSKDLNPLTNRCVKKCKQNYDRNNKFKCVKK